MKTDDLNVSEVRAASTAGGGTALTSSASLISLVPHSRYLALMPRNFSTAVVVKFALNPWLTVVTTTDNLATSATQSDATDSELQDGDTTLALTLNSMAARPSYIYVGSHQPFRGIAVDVNNTNSNAATLTGEYWTGTGWTDLSITDGTANAGATFGQDGNITWTMPAGAATTTWTQDTLAHIGSILNATILDFGMKRKPLYWMRLYSSAAFDASVTVLQMRALNRSTAYAEIPAGMYWEQDTNEPFAVGFGGFASVEALTDAGTANLIVNCGAVGQDKFNDV